jgi:CheY-like chemotaxis protein
VETFASAEEFLAADRRVRPDCLVLDVHLGGIGGLELQERLLAAGERTPIVFITPTTTRRRASAPARLAPQTTYGSRSTTRCSSARSTGRSAAPKRATSL